MVISASGVDSTIAALSEAYNQVTAVTVPRDTRSMHLQLQCVALPNVQFNDLQVSKSTVCAPFYPRYAVCLPISGTIRITSRSGGTALVCEGSGVVISPDEAILAEYLSDECRFITVLLDRSDMEAELSALLGRGIASPLRFEPRLKDVGDGSFSQALRLLRHEMESPDGLTSIPAMSVRLGRLVVAGLLMSQPSNYLAELTRPSAVCGPRAIRAAVALIEEHPTRIKTVGDIAKAVGLSVRALEEGFRRHVGTPPMTYVRDVRMARAHAELTSADADVTTATDVAVNWEFWHYGRFAAAYRQRYGCTPSQTLRGECRAAD